MALRGNLKDFSLPDVFQLVTLSRKTGILRIKRADGAEGSVWFREGDVFFAQSNWHREPLGERLVSAGKITPSALARVLEVQKGEGDEGRRVGQILVDEGYITDKVLEAFVQEQIQDTIFDLFRWDEGDFDFDPLEGVPDEDIGLSVSIENIVMEGSRRLEEWNRIKKKIPSMEIVFKMATAPGEGTFEISLKPIEWNLLLLVDGTRSVSDLATETNRTDFEVARVLYGLFSAGLLEVASDEEVEKLRAERERLEARAAELRGAAAAAPPVKKKAAPAVPQAPAPPEGPATPREPEREHEMPTFLTQQSPTSASAEDMAVFEEMMGAVLQAPAPVEEIPPVEAEATPEEPAAMPEAPELPEAPEVPEVPETAEVPEPAEVPEAPAEVPEPPEEVPPADLLEPLSEPRVEVPVEAGEPEPELPEVSASDFFTQESAEIPAPPVEEPGETEEYEPEPPQVSEPMSVIDTTPEAPPVEVETPLPEVPEPIEEPREQTIAEPEEAALEAAEEVAVEEPSAEDVAIEIVPEPLEDEELEQPAWSSEESTDDLSDLLSALREEAEEPVAPEDPGAEPVLETEEDAPSGVISTDAFLSDFDDMSGSAFSGGLGDELTALTGGGRARPNVVSSTPPVSEPAAIKRDQMVDKDLVMKVIEGIKNL